jgi:rare lipoprotein A
MMLFLTFQPVHKVNWYDLHGRRMANGKIFDREGMTCAASSAYKLGEVLEVQSTKNKRKIRVTVTDRGNFEKKGVSLDLSPRAFSSLFPLQQGVGRVYIKIIK